MKLTRWKAAGIAAGAAVLVLLSAPAHAGSTSIADPTGVDYDAACTQSTIPPDTTPPPNSIKSPGGPGGTRDNPAGDGCRGSSTYDGSTESLDLNHGTDAVKLESDATGHVVGTFNIDGTLPPPGSTTKSQAAYDLPNNTFVGGTYFGLFQNKTIQTNVAYTACPQIPPRPTPILQRFGTWHDGYHFFVAYSVTWDGLKWIHSAQIGEYAPDGGFGFFELGVNDGVDTDGDGSLWDYANTHHPVDLGGTFDPDEWTASYGGSNPTTITVKAPGVYKNPDTTNCLNGHFDYWFAKAGDVIANAKGLTTGDAVVTLPATVPASATCNLTGGAVCESDITSVGGFVAWSDTTDGNSLAGPAGQFGNIAGIALTPGAVGGTDTLGPGPNCPTPTVGGAIPQNPNFTPNQACHIDDDNVFRGAIWQEFWDTTHGFTF